MVYVKSEEVKAAQDVVKEKLLLSALIILAKSGMEAVTVRNVARRAGCALGMVYKLYPGKDEMLAALANRKLADDLGAIEVAMRKRLTPSTQIAAALAAFYGQTKRPRLTRALFEIPHYREGVLGIFRRLMHEQENPEIAAVLAVSIVYGSAIFAKRQDPDTVATAALRAIGFTYAAAENAVVNARYATT